MMSFWIACQDEQLEQGDYLPGCWIPVVGADFDPSAAEPQIGVGQSNLIIVTQSCDLANEKIQLTALCPIADLATWEQLNPDYARRGFWESARQGRREGLHMLSSFTNVAEARNTLVADFRQIFSLPVPYLRKHATGLGSRWRLQSPYREHFSQAFARFFMRVGLPTAIPAFK
jgi:hypothetical protein